jgi:predicted nucleotidyltransferase
MFTQEQILEMVAAIVRAVHPIHVIVFGSYARGAMREGSDVDLLIVERESFNGIRSRWEEIKTIRKVLHRFKGAKDILVYSQEEVDRLRSSLNHVVGTAFREGKVLYEA